jgi:mannose-6-phosphate isomerase-like protein (cupin superfamily)
VHEPIYTHDGDDQYRRGDGPRAFFLYRDLATRGSTGDRIHFHIVRATEAGLGTGWHYHTMSQWFMVIGGHADISVEDHPKQPLGRGDAMCIGSGPQMRHNVTDFSSDYLVLEMCIPADYDTIAVDRPEGGAGTPV